MHKFTMFVNTFIRMGLGVTGKTLSCKSACREGKNVLSNKESKECNIMC